MKQNKKKTTGIFSEYVPKGEGKYVLRGRGEGSVYVFLALQLFTD